MDSRITPSTSIGLLPGEMFVHRNVANLENHTDMNCLSVIQFAVEVLKVKHIIVCGHYGCGGVKAAFDDSRFGLIDNWLRHIQDMMHKYQSDLDAHPDYDARMDKLCEINVIEQVVSVGENHYRPGRMGPRPTARGARMDLHDRRRDLQGPNVSVTSLEQLDSMRDATFARQAETRPVGSVSADR